MGRRLYVGNLPYSATEDQLSEMFSRAGKVDSVRVMRDMATGRARGFAFVEMSSDEEAQKAISEFHEQQTCACRQRGAAEAGRRLRWRWRPRGWRRLSRRRLRRWRRQPQFRRRRLQRRAAERAPLVDRRLRHLLLHGPAHQSAGRLCRAPPRFGRRSQQTACRREGKAHHGFRHRS